MEWASQHRLPPVPSPSDANGMPEMDRELPIHDPHTRPRSVRGIAVNPGPSDRPSDAPAPSTNQSVPGEAPAIVELWWAPLTVGPLEGAGLWDALTPGERRRAEGSRRPGDRDRIALGRGWLRVLLGQRLGLAPGAVEIVREGPTKPSRTAGDLHFSSARSGDLALFALSDAVAVGVDVERLDAARDLAGIADRFFTAHEHAALSGLPPADQIDAVYRCWTRKEALLKGIGVGFGVDPATVEVWSAGDAPARVAGWRVELVDVHPQYAAAVAGEESEQWVVAPVRRLRWSPR